MIGERAIEERMIGERRIAEKGPITVSEEY